jgi:dethiobiotin synthetase
LKRIFVTGISTEVGKTLAAAIITEALEADYWKPVQAGDLDDSDSHKIARLISNDRTVIHPPSYSLKTPMSPHAAAELEGQLISLDDIREPETGNHLVIEGAGGLLVPLNDRDTMADLIKPHYLVVLVSRHYLGSINHTLLSLELLERIGQKPVILFSGNEHPSTERIILQKTGVPMLGRISEESDINQELIRYYARLLLPALQSI